MDTITQSRSDEAIQIVAAEFSRDVTAALAAADRALAAGAPRDPIIDPLLAWLLDVRARHSGPNTFIDVTIALEDGTPLDQAHSVAEQVEAAVQATVPKSSVMVHIDPIHQIILA